MFVNFSMEVTEIKPFYYQDSEMVDENPFLHQLNKKRIIIFTHNIFYQVFVPKSPAGWVEYTKVTTKINRKIAVIKGFSQPFINLLYSTKRFFPFIFLPYCII